MTSNDLGDHFCYLTTHVTKNISGISHLLKPTYEQKITREQELHTTKE